MPKEYKLIISIGSIFSLILIAMIILSFTSKFETKLSGKIMYQNVGEKGGITIKDFDKMTDEFYLKGESVNDPLFVNDGQKIIFYSYRLSGDSSNPVSDINLYDFITKKVDKLITIPYEVNCPTLITNNLIGFTDLNGVVHLFDLKSKKDIIITTLKKTDSYISWNHNDTFIFSDGEKIYEYNIKTSKETFLTDGAKPTFSNKNDKIVYVSPYKKLVLLDIKSGTKDVIAKINNVSFITWSPDDKHIAYLDQQKGFVDNAWNLNIVEINSKKQEKIESFFNTRRISWR